MTKGGKKLVLVLRNEGKFWYEAPCCCFLVDVHCGFRVGSGWFLLFPGFPFFDFHFLAQSLRLISMLGIHTACSTQETLPAAHV